MRPTAWTIVREMYRSAADCERGGYRIKAKELRDAAFTAGQALSLDTFEIADMRRQGESDEQSSFEERSLAARRKA